jgi:hypothetical protein
MASKKRKVPARMKGEKKKERAKKEKRKVAGKKKKKTVVRRRGKALGDRSIAGDPVAVEAEEQSVVVARDTRAVADPAADGDVVTFTIDAEEDVAVVVDQGAKVAAADPSGAAGSSAVTTTETEDAVAPVSTLDIMAGVEEDVKALCDRVVDLFDEWGSLRFSYFVDIWRDMNFGLVSFNCAVSL